jgi:TolB-like protein/class 3 adenylate cyclase
VITEPEDRERRLATVLMADVVGYSRLMDADEEGTFNALRAARTEVLEPKIEEYGARIVKHLGDGFLAEFPTVMAAIRFAMSFQEEMGRRAEGLPKDRQLRVRIGVNLGDVIVDEDGDIFGDGVNIAARLETLGIPGGICISGPVYESVHKKLDVDFDDLGDQSVKNIPTPVHAYDVRWEGEVGTPDERAVKPTPKHRPVALMAGALALVVALGFFAFDQLVLDPARDAERVQATTEAAIESGKAATADNSIVVLPFVNMSDDASNEYFSDGISEELLNLLAKIPKLRVAARTSSFFYKDKLDTITLAEVAQQLQVAHVLEGSVRKSGNQVRITAQLIKADDGFHLWSQTYDRTLDNIFAIQDEIASEVVAQLKITLLGDVPTVRETDPQAYALYLQGRHQRRQGSVESMEQTQALLQQALAIDPGFSAAWSELGSVYITQANTAMLRSIDEGNVLARDAISNALMIDPDFAPAHALLGWIAMNHDNDLAAAARHLERALQLEPGNTEIIRRAARLNVALDRLDEAIALIEVAIAHDPVNPQLHANLALFYIYAGRWDKVIDTARTTLTLSPGYVAAQYNIGQALLFKGEPQAALEAMQLEDSIWGMIGLPLAYHALGRVDESDTALAALIEQYEQGAA